MGGRNGGQPVKVCPACGRDMEYGDRAKVEMSWEYDNSFRKLVYSGRTVCRDCAIEMAEFACIRVPEKVRE